MTTVEYAIARVVRIALILLIGGFGCQSLDRFDTGDGAFCGNVVAASFVRQGFDHRPRLQLLLDADDLAEAPGSITTDDALDGPCAPEATFEAAALRPPSRVNADALSTLEFASAQDHNFIAWADSTCEGTYLAVVSLLHDGNAEVRLTKSVISDDGQEVGPFGVFQLRRSSQRCTRVWASEEQDQQGTDSADASVRD